MTWETSRKVAPVWVRALVVTACSTFAVLGVAGAQPTAPPGEVLPYDGPVISVLCYHDVAGDSQARGAAVTPELLRSHMSRRHVPSELFARFGLA